MPAGYVGVSNTDISTTITVYLMIVSTSIASDLWITVRTSFLFVTYGTSATLSDSYASGGAEFRPYLVDYLTISGPVPRTTPIV